MVRYYELSDGDLEGATHVVVRTSHGGKEREFVLMEWCKNTPLSLDLPPFWGEDKTNLYNGGR